MPWIWKYNILAGEVMDWKITDVRISLKEEPVCRSTLAQPVGTSNVSSSGHRLQLHIWACLALLPYTSIAPAAATKSELGTYHTTLHTLPLLGTTLVCLRRWAVSRLTASCVLIFEELPLFVFTPCVFVFWVVVADANVSPILSLVRCLLWSISVIRCCDCSSIFRESWFAWGVSPPRSPNDLPDMWIPIYWLKRLPVRIWILESHLKNKGI